MLLNQTLDKLDALGLFGMAMGVREQLESTQYANLSFEDRLGVLVDREAEVRDSRRLALRLRAAKLRQEATVEDIDFRTPRGLDRSVIMNLAQAGWVTAKHNLLITGPTGTGKSHTLVGCGVRAVERGMKVRYLVAADLIETLYRGLADNTVGKVISQLLRNELILIDELGFAPLDDTGSQLLFRFVASAYERRSLGVGSHWPFEEWGRFLPVHTTAVSMLDRLLHHAVVVVTEGESFWMREAKQRGGGRRRTA